MKRSPLIVKAKPGLPAAVREGVIEAIDGTGLGGGLMMRATELERPLVPAPECGLRVLTKAVPGVATRAAGTVAVMPVTLPELSVSN